MTYEELVKEIADLLHEHDQAIVENERLKEEVDFLEKQNKLLSDELLVVTMRNE